MEGEHKSIRHVIGELFSIEGGRASSEIIRRRILEGAKVDGIHLYQLMAAMLIASIGLNLNSTEAVIGAMLICPLMGSVFAIAYGIATLDHKIIHSSIMGITIQVLTCLVTSTLYFTISPISTNTEELVANSTATIWGIIIALVGGFAGALGMSRRQEPSTLVAGVAVATALMPPLCSVGYGLASGDFPLALSSLYNFLSNVVFIGFGVSVVLILLRVPIVSDLNGDGVVSEDESREVTVQSHKLRRRLLVTMLIFSIPALLFSYRLVERTIAQNGTVFETVDSYDTKLLTRELKILSGGLVDYRIGTEESYDEKAGALRQHTVATVTTKKELTEVTKAQMRMLIKLHVQDVEDVRFNVVGG